MKGTAQLVGGAFHRGRKGSSMTYTFKISYIGCQNCQAKVHCDECETRLAEAIMRLSGVHGASVHMAPKTALVDCQIDEDTLVDALEDIGIFVE